MLDAEVRGSCQRKIAYISRARAKMTRGRGNNHLRVYHCKRCGFWHIGHYANKKFMHHDS